MKSDHKELIGFPACMLIVILGVYGLMKLLMALPSSATAEGILGGMLMIGFVGVPLFFGVIIAVVAICMWMSTIDHKP